MTAPLAFQELSWAGGVFDAAGRITFGANGSVRVEATGLDLAVVDKMQRVLGGSVGTRCWHVPAGHQIAVLQKLQPHILRPDLKDLATRVIMYRMVAKRGKKAEGVVKKFLTELVEKHVSAANSTR